MWSVTGHRHTTWIIRKRFNDMVTMWHLGSAFVPFPNAGTAGVLGRRPLLHRDGPCTRQELHEDPYCPYCLSKLFAYVDFRLLSDIQVISDGFHDIAYCLEFSQPKFRSDILSSISLMPGGDLHGKLEPGTGLGPEVASRRACEGASRFMTPW